MENRLKRKLAADTLTFCLGVNQARTPNIVMIAAAAGFDAIYVDLEHNPTSLETCSMLCVTAIPPASPQWSASAPRTATSPPACWTAAPRA
jgi:2-keto-3-deoxy-L-rhamnonate aldolase RhmA